MAIWYSLSFTVAQNEDVVKNFLDKHPNAGEHSSMTRLGGALLCPRLLLISSAVDIFWRAFIWWNRCCEVHRRALSLNSRIVWSVTLYQNYRRFLPQSIGLAKRVAFPSRSASTQLCRTRVGFSLHR